MFCAFFLIFLPCRVIYLKCKKRQTIDVGLEKFSNEEEKFNFWDLYILENVLKSLDLVDQNMVVKQLKIREVNPADENFSTKEIQGGVHLT